MHECKRGVLHKHASLYFQLVQCCDAVQVCDATMLNYETSARLIKLKIKIAARHIPTEAYRKNSGFWIATFCHSISSFLRRHINKHVFA